MKRKFVQIAALCLSVSLLIVSGGRQNVSAAPPAASGRMIQVGLHHDGPSGTGSMEGLNLENEVGSGFRFGYYDSDHRFVPLGSTQQTLISVAKAENVYYGTYNSYKSYHSALTASDVAVGEYYLQLPGSYPSFAKARAAADAYEDKGGFPAYIGGEYFVRMGSCATSDEAAAKQADWAAQGLETELTRASAYGVNVVITGTSTILFQFDDLGGGTGLGVEPNAGDLPEDGPEDPGEDGWEPPGEDGPEAPGGDGGETPGEDGWPDNAENGRAVSGKDGWAGGAKYTTWSKNRLYYGGFRFERIDGGNMTVVNILDLEDYLKGVVPHEMSDSWPLEALKAQAVAARSYTVTLGTKHSSGHFDICNNTHCQVYSGLTSAGSNSDLAVASTAGEVVLYNNTVVPTYYYSSSGGASENSSVVWGSSQDSYPYLLGKPDPYEDSLNLNNSYTKTVSSDTLVAGLKNLGIGEVGTSIVSVAIVSLTDAGNPKQLTFTDNLGTQFTVNTRYVKSIVGLNSFRYGFEAAEASSSEISVNGAPPADVSGLYAIDGNGKVVPVAGGSYVLTGDGMIQLEQGGPVSTGGIGNLGGTTGNNGSFTFIGRGLGHNVGMSQWGAYAMAQQGKTYLDILQFYYTDVTVGLLL